MTLTAEKIREANKMRVLWQQIELRDQDDDVGRWSDPFVIVSPEAPIDVELITRNISEGILRLYCAPGHITLHDGSSTRPEWVKEDALLMTYWGGTWWSEICPINWSRVEYFIVLPEVTP